MRFMEIMDFALDETGCAELRMDARFLSVIDGGSLQVIGLVCAKPLDLRVDFAQDHIRISSSTMPDEPVYGTITLCGIARLHSAKRFPEFSEHQKKKNDLFWSTAFQP